ncbi:DUF535 domain-containing protein [Vibrio metschnikovii]|nr:DUF535 domain-containing protein [Vibrio metschnikovii]
MLTNIQSDLPEWAAKIYPESKGWDRIRKNWRFRLWALLHPQAVRRMLSLVEQHFLFVAERFGERCTEIMSDQGVSLLSIEDKNGEAYDIRLNRGASREGSIGLSLVNQAGTTIYSISFHFSDHGKTVYIGALQGPSEKIENRQQIIKDLTRTVHGLRTKALMVELALLVSRQLGVERCYAISNRGHIYQALRYIGSKRNKVSFDYDELWTEYEAEKISRYRYRVAMMPARKEIETLNRNKRRLYTKRYQWLDELELAIGERLKQLSC